MSLGRLLVLCAVLVALGDCLLFREGAYKTRKKGRKERITSVEALEPGRIPDSNYLKISAVIPRLHRAGVRDFRNLQDLTLSSCGIIDLEPGAFLNVSSLSRLNLKENAIEHVRAGVFNKLNLSVIFLNKNEIKTIDGDAFDDMPTLTKIKLNSNKLAVWDANWFKNTPSLNHLSFRRNLLEELPDYAFRHVHGWHLVDGKEVTDTKILLSNNKITAISPKAFSGLGKLGQLYLDRNRIREIDPTVFSDLEMIRTVELSRNNLTEVPEGLFASVRVNNFYARSNRPLRCVPRDLVRAASKVVVTGIRKIDCECIGKLRSVGVVESDC
ncbi:carboxypeptidase N subunit 2-like [Cylas formicarius]|uniref:carboxypeptidase N subunit 2-like n=1 Tax=Cylas formicarius TaxID=197179 RepID=UPI00295876F8|nr:carboxypeptidase N subunit 2-like [Cylas formicarius]